MKKSTLVILLSVFSLHVFCQAPEIATFSTDNEYSFIKINENQYGLYQEGINNVSECVNYENDMMTITECPSDGSTMYIGTSRSVTLANYLNSFKLSVTAEDISDKLETSIDTITSYKKNVPNKGDSVNTTYYELLIKFNYKNNEVYSTGIVTNSYTAKDLQIQLDKFKLYKATEKNSLIMSGKFHYHLLVEDNEIVTRTNDIVVYKK